MRSNIQLHNGDCMEALRGMEDNQFELAIVDPPYGIGISSNPVRQQHEKKQWDSSIPDDCYFTELMRVSSHQIIWGGNYFDLPPSQGFLVWDKVQPHEFSLAMCEYAWMSQQKPANIWKRSVLAERNKIHPTQKPVALYKWLLNNYAKEGDTILDTHLGSGSIAIACHDLKFDLVGYELDEDYFKAASARLSTHQSQGQLF